MKRSVYLLFLSMSIVVSMTSCTSYTSEGKSKHLYRILIGDKYGFINSDGVVVIEPKYEKAELFFQNGYCVVKENSGKYCLIDEQGTTIREIPDSAKNVCASKVGNKIYFIVKGGISISSMYDYNLSPGVYNINSKSYIYDFSWERVGEAYEDIWGNFQDGLCAVKKGHKWGYVDFHGNLVIDTIYDAARSFSNEGFARVICDNTHMYIDTKGECVIKVDSAITGFDHNRAAVIINGEKCIIDKNGKIVCKLNFDNIEPFADDGFATVILDGKASIIDTMGNVIISTKYDNIGHYYNYNGKALAVKNGRYGIIDSIGNEIVKCEYYSGVYNPHNDNVFILCNWGWDEGYCYHYFDSNGNLIWKDMPTKRVRNPQYMYNPTRKDFIEYFDTNIANLDPIEGIYYVTVKDYYQHRDNYNNIGLNNSSSMFYAVIRKDAGENDFWAYCLDGSNKHWVNKFVKLGNSNNYAIVKTNDDIEYSSEGEMTLEDLNNFDFRLETGKNNWYNFFVTYKFTRDYPSINDIEQYQTPEWTGSGFAIADGYIATNYHVTNGAKTIRIKGVNGNMESPLKGVVIASDKEHDLSIIKIVDTNFNTFGKIPYGIGKRNVDVGDNIFVLGYPLISSMGNEIKLTEGIISSSTGFKGDDSMYQISAAVQPGNSGGPLYNEEGDVVGIVCAKHSKAENANYAIKLVHLKNLVENSGYKIIFNDDNKIRSKKLSSKVKIIKDYVYLIECSSK